MVNMSRFIDLSHAIVPGLTTYPGLPPPVIEAHMTRQQSESSYEAGTSFHIGKIAMVANTGTYIDAFHRYADGLDTAQLPLEWLADLPAVVLHVDAGVREIGPDLTQSRSRGQGGAGAHRLVDGPPSMRIGGAVAMPSAVPATRSRAPRRAAATRPGAPESSQPARRSAA